VPFIYRFREVAFHRTESNPSLHAKLTILINVRVDENFRLSASRHRGARFELSLAIPDTRSMRRRRSPPKTETSAGATWPARIHLLLLRKKILFPLPLISASLMRSRPFAARTVMHARRFVGISVSLHIHLVIARASASGRARLIGPRLFVAGDA